MPDLPSAADPEDAGVGRNAKPDASTAFLGAINFSSGRLDPAAYAAANEMFAVDRPDDLAAFGEQLRDGLRVLRETQPAFADAGQA
ncbi:MAG: hypothetical protein AAGJ97_10880, partial [Planctomycetota bacterium]